MTSPPRSGPSGPGPSGPLRPGPPAFDSRLARAPRLGASIAPPAGEVATVPPPQPGSRRRTGTAAVVVLVGVVVVLGALLVAYFLNALGVAASLVGLVLALVPLAFVLWMVRIVDRWEPEPRWLVAIALGWGAVVAVAVALGVDIARILVLGMDDTSAGAAVQAVVQAPIVEESAKGLGVYVVFVIGRRYFDGPVDGIVYGALVGAGFAFTENIQYFAVSLLEGGIAQTSVTFFFRGILSPFAHVMFTSVTGFALGLAARRGMGAGAALGPWIVGIAGAIVLHGLWNGSAVFSDFVGLYLTLQVPLFLAFVLGVVALRREEARLTRQRLGEFAAAGWYTAAEVEMLATGAGRKRAVAWARTLPGDRAGIMRAFIRDSTGLAAARQRAITGRDPGASADERMLLGRAVADRAALLT